MLNRCTSYNRVIESAKCQSEVCFILIRSFFGILQHCPDRNHQHIKAMCVNLQTTEKEAVHFEYKTEMLNLFAIISAATVNNFPYEHMLDFNGALTDLFKRRIPKPFGLMGTSSENCRLTAGHRQEVLRIVLAFTPVILQEILAFNVNSLVVKIDLQYLLFVKNRAFSDDVLSNSRKFWCRRNH